ncbi:hypothetical protein ACVII1_006257 [Bradyrhizobium elkanii]|uniref:hypothetical protein n=1 Tax=Bradyrhizobium TaxID=374 RepID=UPI0027120941|nr:hypothetical protein [Bradyrhizobium elkanii]WLA40202.1 hypothetical protein QNJ95_01060 [Bradyrhizobium elkanii]
MSNPTIRILRVERRKTVGAPEELTFDGGVNVLVGRPNTGKTRWLQTLDFLLGDNGANPFESDIDEHLAVKYGGASAMISVSGEVLYIERKWDELGAKSKVFVNGIPMGAQEFQRLLLEKLNIPLVHFPKGSPYSGQTWPELSFRMLLRHIFRQQRFWTDIADRQPEAEQHACLLQFLGLAQSVFSDEYGELIRLKSEVSKLEARREQYEATLQQLAGDVLSGADLKGSITMARVTDAMHGLEKTASDLRTKRTQTLESIRTNALSPGGRGRSDELGEKRAKLIVGTEELRKRAAAVTERVAEIRAYQETLKGELERLGRLNDAGEVLSDLRVTHCPACDQSVVGRAARPHSCFLCNQVLRDEPTIQELGVARVKFESERLKGELEEADQLLNLLGKDSQRISTQLTESTETMKMVENELAPLRAAVSALVSEQVSAIDMELGELSERQRQLGRLKGAVELGMKLGEEIAGIEKRIKPLDDTVSAMIRATDFDDASEKLAEGMNHYLGAINKLKPGIWPHNDVSLDITANTFRFKVGSRKWQAALGGTDSLYFLMAYHYGLLTLSVAAGCHYPGLAILDMPAEFAGELIEDKENFIVQPFIELLDRDEFADTQMIITGASFAGLEGANRRSLTEIYVST